MEERKNWRFVKQVVEGRWFTIFASFLVMIGCGSPYLFGTYSKLLKTKFNYNQTQLNTLGFAKDLGSNLGVFAGLFAEILAILFFFFHGYPPLIIQAPKYPHERKVFYHFLYIAITIAIFILFLTITQRNTVFSHGNYIGGVVVIVVLISLPLLIAIKEEFFLFKLNQQTKDPSVVSIPVQKLEEIPETSLPLSLSNNLSNPQRGEDFSILQALFSIDMTLIFIATISACGSSNGKGLTCKGAHCFSESFIILVGVTTFGAMASFVLAYRTREFYKGDIYKRYRDEQMWVKLKDDQHTKKVDDGSK
uniref:Nodulin-like domain-containing protein n=1 Tax=Cucumis sativus TaxID=3659 RepID=A0A0A0LVD8_CUCSA